MRAAAPYQQEREADRAESGVAWSLRKEDLQRKVRVRRASNLILFAVDASWSMAVSERMQATKGAIMSLLTDAYQRRDRVGLVVFQKDRASLVLSPTNSVLLAKEGIGQHPRRRQDAALGRAVAFLRNDTARADAQSRHRAHDHPAHGWRRQRLHQRAGAAG